MKRNLSKLALMAIAVLAGVVFVQTASAQAKRKPTAKPAARQAAKPAAKKPAEKVNNNFAILEFDEWINDNNPLKTRSISISSTIPVARRMPCVLLTRKQAK